jgi:hypothetical protein
VESVQTADAAPVFDLVATQTELEKLRERDHPVLLARNLGDPLVWPTRVIKPVTIPAFVPLAHPSSMIPAAGMRLGPSVLPDRVFSRTRL